MKSVRPKLKKLQIAGGVEKEVRDELRKANARSILTAGNDQQELEQELRLSKRLLDLEWREQEMERREQELKDTLKKANPGKLYCRQIKDINKNIGRNWPEGTLQETQIPIPIPSKYIVEEPRKSPSTEVKELDFSPNLGENVPSQEATNQLFKEKLKKEDERIRELQDVVKQQQEILKKVQNEREEEKLSMKLIAEMLKKNDEKHETSVDVKFKAGEVKTSTHGQDCQDNKNRGPTSADGGREDKRQESENNNITSKIRCEVIPVSVSGDKTGIPKHMNPQGMFMDAGLCSLLVKNIGSCSFENPTPVQQHCIPIILAGRDVMTRAESGAGKTAAFLIPVVQMLMQFGSVYRRQQKTVSPEALIIVPTRELVIQVYEEARKLTRGSVVKPAVLYGGTNPYHQARDLGNGCNIL